jgi:hypothetical protein
MPLVVSTIRDLALRGTQIQKLLRPLSPIYTGPAWKRTAVRKSIIIAAHDGSPPASGYRDYRFPTFVPNFSAMYHEQWDEVNSQEVCLNRAYLNIYRTKATRLQEEEFICLHCDPNESDGPHKFYKQGPHLHISVAGDPFHHSHIALNLSHLLEVLASVDSVFQALEIAVIMLREQVLNHLRGT